MLKRFFYIPLILICLISATTAFGQPDKSLIIAYRAIDSIRILIKNDKVDTSRISSMNRLCYILVQTDQYKQADSFAHAAVKESEKINDKHYSAGALFSLGYVDEWHGEYKEAISSFSRSLDLNISLGDSAKLADIYKGLGDVYIRQDNYPMALEMEFKALPLYEKYNDRHGYTGAVLSIGNIYAGQEDYENALLYYNKALKADTANFGNPTILGNMGDIDQLEKKFPEAIVYSTKALQLFKGTGDKEGQIDAIDNLGEVCFQQADYSKALDYYMQGLSISKEIGSKELIADNFIRIGKAYEKQKIYTEALTYANQGILLAKQIGIMTNVRDGEQILASTYDSMHNVPQAYLHYKAYLAIHDTLENQDNTTKLTRKEMTLEYEKKQAMEKLEQDKKDEMTRAEDKKQKMFTVFTGILALAVSIIATIIFFSLRTTRNQKRIIEEQKLLVDEKNKNITDSINYALRIQAAILPPLNLIKQHLPESFLLYKPKDIVAGDFYWMERAGDTLFIAAADCTGHGVSGALVSVVCSNALNRTVKEFHVTEPGKILDKVRQLVLETFEKSEDKVQDGMDISLCCINTKTYETQYSGAYNSLWYIQNNEMLEVAADKQPIGKFDKPTPFNTYQLKLKKGDTLYLFTDGYADQFGGPNGKKFKYKKLQDLILANAGKAMDAQKSVLEHTLEEWQGSLEQVDDILVIGIRI
jgi:tetratricopeptide (TPR) repeat protein